MILTFLKTHRKYSLTVFTLLLILSTSFVMSEKYGAFAEASKKHFLKMEGRPHNIVLEKPGKTTIEVLYLESKLQYARLETDSTSGLCSFKLPLQEYFLIRFTKPGYLTKTITVDTHLPEKMAATYYCEFDYEMFPRIAEVNAEPMLKDPIAMFFFNQRSQNFDYDQRITENINARIRSMYTEYYAAHPAPVPDDKPLSKSDRRIPSELK